ncbi:hypothetical protein GCM10027610_103770 [Dactylosporangium cerinum]
MRAARPNDRHGALQPKENPQNYPFDTDQGIASHQKDGESVPKHLSQYVVPIGIVMIILMMVVPLPAFLLDTLIAANITLALVIVLVSMYVKRPLEFSSFPSLLLIATLFRLALNISATRLVLTDGFAGAVIDAFGHFVVGGSLIVGLVIFLILFIVQFMVVTKGAERVAEVGARFTLDAMPGKQMAIDADLNAGLIDEATARKRRTEITSEASFYGAMDGASKFVKGDAIAAIIITLVNLIGGFAIGMLQRGMSPADSIATYSLLSVGDGLVSQIPALLLSVATGLIVTRSANDGDMGATVSKQLSQNRRALQIGGGAALALCLIPGLPKLPFLLVGAAVLIIAQRLPKPVSEADQQAAAAAEAEPPPPDPTETLLGEMRVDPLELALAPDLVDLVDASGETCSNASGRCAARWPWSSASSCRRCGPATTWSCRCPPTRCASAASRSAAARPRPARSWRSATAWSSCPAGPASSRSSASPASGSRPSCATRPTSPAPRSWTGPRSSSRTWRRSSACTPAGCSAARTSARSPRSSSAPTRSSWRS